MVEATERNMSKLRERFPRATGNLLFGFVYRHTLAGYRKFLEPTELGVATYVQATWERARGVPGRGLFTNLAASGGGAGIDLGIHVLDLAWWALGCPQPQWAGAVTSSELAKTTEVYGYGNYNRAQFEVEDTIAGAVAFENSIIAVHAAFASNVPGGVEEQAKIIWRGTRSGFEFPLHTGNQDPQNLLPRVAGERFAYLHDTALRTPRPRTVQEGYKLQVAHLLDVLEGEAAPIMDPQEGVTLMRMVDGLYRSAMTGKPVML